VRAILRADPPATQPRRQRRDLTTQGQAPTSAKPRPAAARRWVLHPWLIAAYPVVFLYAHNILYVDGGAALRVLPMALGAVTLIFLGLWAATRSTLKAGLLSTLYTALFFAFGPVLDFVGGWGVGRTGLLAAWALVAVVATLLIVRGRESEPLNRGLNLVTGLLLLMPLFGVATSLWQDFAEARAERDSVGQVLSGGVTSSVKRDIYYIVLDEYQRRDHLLDAYGFDNSDFEQALVDRGFLIASEATSNYPVTLLSLPATLNMQYIDTVLSHPSWPRAAKRLRAMTERHQVGQILQEIGYTYVHVSSGKHPTATRLRADVIFDSSSAGVKEMGKGSLGEVQHDYREFAMLVLGTTLAGRLIERAEQEKLVVGKAAPYTWYAPERTLGAFATTKEIARNNSLTFTFLHVIKPHAPYMFDRDGNVLEKPPGWDWHDGRDDSQAMLDQLVYMNTLTIDLIDTILERSEVTPIIIIQGDHGENTYEQDLPARLGVLSAFLLPDGGDTRIYPSISNVNTFRAVLSHYFGQDLEPLPDLGWVYDSEERLVQVIGPGSEAPVAE
jgi:hypothetical protein